MRRAGRAGARVGLVALATGVAGAQDGGCARTLAAAVAAAIAPARAQQGSEPTLVPAALVQSGYRVKAVRWDRLQQQSWAVVERCEHPELPALAVLTKLSRPLVGAASSAVASSAVAVMVASTGFPAATGVPTATGLPAAAGLPAAPVAGETVSAAVIRANAAVVAVKTGDVVRLWKADERAHIELIGTAEENGTVGAKVRVRLVTPKEADGQTAPPQYLAGVVRGPADVEIEQ